MVTTTKRAWKMQFWDPSQSVKMFLNVKESNFNAKMGQHFHICLRGQGRGSWTPPPLQTSLRVWGICYIGCAEKKYTQGNIGFILSPISRRRWSQVLTPEEEMDGSPIIFKDWSRQRAQGGQNVWKSHKDGIIHWNHPPSKSHKNGVMHWNHPPSKSPNHEDPSQPWRANTTQQHK